MSDNATTDTLAQVHARAWLHSFGINTESYVRDGIDHPAMRTLPHAFEAFAKAKEAARPVRHFDAERGIWYEIPRG